MNKTLHSGASRLLTLISALVLLAILPACSDDAERELPDKGKGKTATLELSLSVPPIVETKAVICEADSASEARKAGFYYEMQVLTTDTTGNAGGHVATKAASSLKNIYAFLFRTDNGAFNGRASIKEAVNLTEKLKLVFSDVTDVNSRLVIIANDAAGADYKSSTDFDSFTGTYTEFQKLTLESDIIKDEDIPYVGSTTVKLDDGNFTLSDPVSLYRMLAQINLTNNTFFIEGGPSRNAINLYNAGKMYFGTANNYDGTGSTVTPSERYNTTATAGNNADSNTWYVGENVQATADAAKAFYIRLGTDTMLVAVNKNPAVGEEYIADGGYAFITYDVYLNNIALRRNNIYNVTVNVSGTLEWHLKQTAIAKSNVTVTSTVVHGGLNIGTLNNAFSPKNQLLQPNTTGTTAQDKLKKTWEEAKAYCAQLRLGGVAAGSWYLPEMYQLLAIYNKRKDIEQYSYGAYYSAFYNISSGYVSATEADATHSWGVVFFTGKWFYIQKSYPTYVRCVRDLN